MTAPSISTDDLRELLERGAPVTVLDVRPAAERAEWSIPGSLHADAYDALRRGDPTALADFHPPNGARVVTVCAAGKTSMLAAERLRARGLDAVSLEGGMRAWSLAWNTAEVPCPGSTARIVQLRRTGKGCLSYVIGSNGEAVVIDASLHPQLYHRLADEHGIDDDRSEEHTSELQSPVQLACRLLLEKKKPARSCLPISGPV